MLASGQVSGNFTPVTANTLMSIASASKWIYGAYVLERRAGLANLSSDDIDFLHFTSGYINLGIIACGLSDTVNDCLVNGQGDLRNGTGPNGPFDYDGGHMQKHAVSLMGLGADTNTLLATEMNNMLGISGVFYSQPQLAGGAVMTATNYVGILRRILSGSLQMLGALGKHPVCAATSGCGAGSTAALHSPISEASSEQWHYSLGHWVEDDPVIYKDPHLKAYSSAGAFGFYPWIDASKHWYGIVARQDKSSSNFKGYASAQCGRLIRAAWLNGKEQITATPVL